MILLRKINQNAKEKYKRKSCDNELLNLGNFDNYTSSVLKILKKTFLINMLYNCK